MEQREWTTYGKKERKQASSYDTSTPRALSRTSMVAKVHAYLPDSISQSVSQSVNQSVVRVYLTT